MKCDKLKAYTLFTTSSLSGQRVYLTNDVDAFLAEKDEEIAQLKQKLEDANELIKTARQILEDAKATAYAEMVDAGMRERRLRRALYKACANWAHEAKFDYDDEFSLWDNMELRCLKKAEEYK